MSPYCTVIRVTNILKGSCVKKQEEDGRGGLEKRREKIISSHFLPVALIAAQR